MCLCPKIYGPNMHNWRRWWLHQTSVQIFVHTFSIYTVVLFRILVYSTHTALHVCYEEQPGTVVGTISVLKTPAEPSSLKEIRHPWLEPGEILHGCKYWSPPPIWILCLQGESWKTKQPNISSNWWSNTKAVKILQHHETEFVMVLS